MDNLRHYPVYLKLCHPCSVEIKSYLCLPARRTRRAPLVNILKAISFSNFFGSHSVNYLSTCLPVQSTQWYNCALSIASHCLRQTSSRCVGYFFYTITLRDDSVYASCSPQLHCFFIYVLFSAYKQLYTLLHHAPHTTYRHTLI